VEIKIEEISGTNLSEYGKIPISFSTNIILQVIPRVKGMSGIEFKETILKEPIKVDHDASPNLSPFNWKDNFDLSNWSFWLAKQGEKAVGGITLAFSTPGVNMLEGREDLGVIWDLRVNPEFRGQGIGKKLFVTALERARELGCSFVKVETQNTNPMACRFYSEMGGELGVINRFAYKDNPQETMLLWYFSLREGKFWIP